MPTSKQVAGIFSTRVFRALGHARFAPYRLRLSVLADLLDSPETTTLGDAFDIAHQYIAEGYRGEYVYKNSIVRQLVLERHDPHEAGVQIEMHTGASIADVVVFNGTSTAYEIKTDRDSFARLDTQFHDYLTCFDLVNLVVSDHKVSAAQKATPDGVGIIRLNAAGDLDEVRPPDSNIGQLDCARLFALLRQDEVLRVLNRTLYYEPDTTPANLWNRTRDLFVSLDVEVAHCEVVSELRDRGRSRLQFARNVAPALSALACATDQSKVATCRTLARLALPVPEAISLDMESRR